MDIEVWVDRTTGFRFDAPVFYLSCVHEALTSADRHLLNDVAALDVEGIDAVGIAVVHAMTPAYLIVHQTLSIQVGILRTKKVHLSNGRITETFAYRSFQLSVIHRSYNKTSLWNPFCTSLGMVVQTHPGIKSQPVGEVLADIYVTGNFVLTLVDHSCQVLTCSHHLVPGLAVDMLIVKANS